MIHLHVVSLKARAGELWVAGTDRGVLRLGFGKAPDARGSASLARKGVLSVSRSPGPLRGALRSLRRYLAGDLDTPRAELDLAGITEFRLRVLEAVQQIPPGKILTYAQIARQAGTPRGARAVGQALAANPIPLFIPCHRVVTKEGEIADYTGGRVWKRALLELETKQMRLPSLRRRRGLAKSRRASRSD